MCALFHHRLYCGCNAWCSSQESAIAQRVILTQISETGGIYLGRTFYFKHLCLSNVFIFLEMVFKLSRLTVFIVIIYLIYMQCYILFLPVSDHAMQIYFSLHVALNGML